MDTYITSHGDSGSKKPPPPPNRKVRFMVSYGGKIQPRLQDTQLSYTGGETKIIYVNRSINFSALIEKLSSVIATDNSSSSSVGISSFKYQLPDEDLGALVSVTSDDDLEHLMHEYDRLYRASPKPARIRIFVFQECFGSGCSERQPNRFLDALNSAPVAVHKMDFLFGLDCNGPIYPNRLIELDLQMEDQILELNRLQISAPPPTVPMYVHAPVSYLPAPAPSVYHTPMMRPPSQGYYYQMRRVPSESMYHAQQVYSVPPVRIDAHSEGIGLPVRQVPCFPETTGKRVYYAMLGGLTSPFQETPVPVNDDDVRTAMTVTGVDGKIVSRVSPI